MTDYSKYQIDNITYDIPEPIGQVLEECHMRIYEMRREIMQLKDKQQSGMDVLMDIIKNSKEFNRHSEASVSSMHIDDVMTLVQEIDSSELVEEYCEVRLIKDKNGVEGTIYSVGHWPNDIDGEHLLGHEDKMLLTIDRVVIS